jgi:D-alanyl-D-alanine carboxypeptidase/D-alanyl-D-alanine-endopeptidase (penicillin-binding protein 4)
MLATLLLALALAAPAEAKKPKSAENSADDADISDEALSARHRIPLSGLAYLVVDAKTGQVLQSRQPKEPFPPASAIKIVSTVAALTLLGAEHRFATELRASGKAENGTLAGDLILKGLGDPVLTHDEFVVMVARLKAEGITRVAGSFVYDASLYKVASAIDENYEAAAAYNAGVAALSINFNVLRLKWERGKDKESLAARFVSQTDHGEVEVDYLKSGFAPSGAAAAYGLVYRNDAKQPAWLLSPGAKAKGEIPVPVKVPDYSAAHVFRKIAAREGVVLPEPVAGVAPEQTRLIHRASSKPLPEIVQRVQRFSNNMAAEMLGLAAAHKLTGKAPSIAEAAAAIGAWTKAQFKDVDWTGFDLRNSSGLTRETRISPEQMVAILRHAQSLRIGNQAYADLLKTYNAGKVDDDDNGAGSTTRKGPREKVEVRAKTGTINFASAVAGYLHTKKGRDVVFAIFVSDYKVREAASRDGTSATTHKEPPPRGWNRRGNEMRRAVVRRWAEAF